MEMLVTVLGWVVAVGLVSVLAVSVWWSIEEFR